LLLFLVLSWLLSLLLICPMATDCGKHVYSQGNWTNGVEFVYCSCSNRVMLGFFLLHETESPTQILKFLISRFNKPPKLLVYDNNCNVHRTCTYLSPSFFDSTNFVIDRLHQPTHTRCSPAFKMDYFRYLRSCNSQVAEQGNSLIESSDLISCISNMKQSNFIRTLKTWMFMYNVRVKYTGNKLDPFWKQVQHLE
jgi:hypothetical protein